MPSGRIIRHWVRPRGRCCSGTCRFSQRGKICQHWKRIPLCANRSRNLGPDEHVGMLTVCQSGKKDLLGVRRWQGMTFSVPESFGAGAALQRCIVTWNLASHWLHGLMICTQLCIILIFKLPREHIYRALKIIIIMIRNFYSAIMLLGGYRGVYSVYRM